jgi:hypothetical protein
MKKNALIVSVLLCLFLISCQKEVDFANGSGGSGGGGGTTGNTLVKTVSKNGSDSIVTIYTYNANKLLIGHKMSGMSQSIDVTNENKYYRNAAGIITRFIQINPNLVAAGIDSVVSIVHYDAAASRYTSVISELSLFGFTVIDSSLLVYDAGGKVIRNDVYQGSPSLGMPMELSLKTSYTYGASGNMTQLDQYSHDPTTGTDDLVSTIKYTYDNKVNAFTATTAFLKSNEAFAIGHGDWTGINNATKIELTSTVAPTANRTITVAYTYNSGNRPATSVNTTTPGSLVENYTYYYQ